jgi:hypothetical protein
MKRKLLILGFLLSATHQLFAQPQNHNVYLLGHSLVNFSMPEMLNDLADNAGYTHNYNVTVGLGANLSWQWTNPASSDGDLYYEVLPTANNDIFIATEAVPLLNHLLWSNTYEYADSFYTMAASYRPDIKFFIYETWHCTDSGTPLGCEWDENDELAWRTRLDADLPNWQSIVNYINEQHPTANAQLVPAGQAMAALYDSIAIGTVPTLSSINQIFSDNIHLTDIGNYYIACVMYATIYQQSPEGLINQTTDIWGGNFNAPSTALATKLQQTAWTAVCNYFNWSCCPQVPQPVITGSITVCNNTQQTYSVPAVAGNTYAWTVTNGIITNGQGTNQITVQWNGSNAGTVNVVQTAE